ncbi:competence protein CoiA family protein [Pseudomonas aeruginosa]|uniref:competence protein CoiA family protein n=1 Tax=Pseudomonas aeruginosa TaxID=287 RepID=UPI000E6A8169|nr:competence protein CoiA family protein [Pseudomonas aeruginosa]MBA5106203.1 hypothetical protein [Pseudomonas aeruginosa]MBD1300230.1 hypothetical protein [Pseudomonas aeruginosa]MBD1340787.1 hypothetical protein [Pseudomonas aeruginosa]MBG4604191.1 hypothetical protein [Pseudomonas aeruginosa]MBH3592971.1 hypothetical protein [Pseudomonas aeruginosa]
MQPDALTKDDQPLWASQFSAKEWDTLKIQSQADPEAFRMPCCRSRAVLKTSINGLQFFAHHSDECATAPETIWHFQAKDLLYGTLGAFGVDPKTEVSGGSGKDRWRADVYFELDGRKIAIELQRSYQNLREFEARQARYERYGVECYWLVRHEVGRTLMKAILRKRWIDEFNRGAIPEGEWVNSTPHFFFGVLAPGAEIDVSWPGGALKHLDLLIHIMTRELRWDGRMWTVSPQ